MQLVNGVVDTHNQAHNPDRRACSGICGSLAVHALRDNALSRLLDLG